MSVLRTSVLFVLEVILLTAMVGDVGLFHFTASSLLALDHNCLSSHVAALGWSRCGPGLPPSASSWYFASIQQDLRTTSATSTSFSTTVSVKYLPMEHIKLLRLCGAPAAARSRGLSAASGPLLQAEDHSRGAGTKIAAAMVSSTAVGVSGKVGFSRDFGWCSCGPSWGPRPELQCPLPLRGTHARSLGVHPISLVRHAIRTFPCTFIFRWPGLHVGQVYYYSISVKQPPVMLLLSSSTRWLLFRFWLFEAASIWDPSLSFIYVLRRRLQQHTSVIGVLLQCWLFWPNFNLRFARSIYPGVCVYDAPATLRQRSRLYHRRRRSYLSFRLQDLDVNVIWFSDENLVIWLQ